MSTLTLPIGTLAEAPSLSTLGGSSFAVLVNQGLDPGVRVVLDDQDDETGTVCFAERDEPYTYVRLDRTGQQHRVASWRLTCVD